MCGIVGVIGAGYAGLNYKEQKVFEQLLYVDALRGEDSTGVFCVSKDAEVKLVKAALDAYTMAYEKAYTEIVDYAYKEGRAIIGHNRKTTVGKSSDANAHPFVVNDEFVFVHNGTLTNHKKINKDVEVDSEALAIHIHAALRSEKEDALDEALAEVYGAYACVFYDQKTEMLYLLRNSERPLWLIELKNGSYIISSEPGFGYAIANRNDLAIEKSFPLETNHLYSFDLSKEIKKPHVRKLKERHHFFNTASTPMITNSRGQENTGVGAIDSVVDLSKNAFKRFRGKFLNTTVRFIVEDYIEKYPNQPDTTPWYVFGVLEQDVHVKESFYPNIVHLIVDKDKMTEFMDNYEGVLLGKVTNISYDRDMKRASVYINSPSVTTETKNAPAISLH